MSHFTVGNQRDIDENFNISMNRLAISTKKILYQWKFHYINENKLDIDKPHIPTNFTPVPAPAATTTADQRPTKKAPFSMKTGL
ncbi:hypothetical protein JOC95_002722 [Bacillus tianshenii]|uniref:Uncharacterized protein n=1 Tax=Sutcliffiella tianshenii TaxID=1463404 RepID=A0ABS2P2K9_9BACI|nr:hypothetical protein [Bacillus tianshenii]